MSCIGVLALGVIVLLGMASSAAGYNNGPGDQDMPTPSGGCSDAQGCHTTLSGNGTVNLIAVADDGVWNAVAESGTLTATVNIDAANSDADIVGVMLLDPEIPGNVKARGWTLIEDPNLNSTPFNFSQRSSVSGDLDLPWKVTAPDSAGTYRIIGRLMFDDGGAVYSHTDTVEMTLTVGVSESDVHTGLAPSQRLTGYPTPFSRSTTIRYQVVNPDHIDLKVYDASGRLVRSLVESWSSAGEHYSVWDGRDDLGREAPEGLYFCVLDSGVPLSACKVVFLR